MKITNVEVNKIEKNGSRLKGLANVLLDKLAIFLILYTFFSGK